MVLLISVKAIICGVGKPQYGTSRWNGTRSRPIGKSRPTYVWVSVVNISEVKVTKIVSGGCTATADVVSTYVADVAIALKPIITICSAKL